MKLFFYLPLLLLILACADNRDSNNGQAPKALTPQDSSKAKDLSTMSLPEALSAKYNSAILNCNLWTRMRGPLFITDTPNDTASIDLLKESTFPKTIKLAAKSDRHSLDIELKLTEMTLTQNGEYSDNYGARYSFANSPVISGEYSGHTITTDPDGYDGGAFKGNNLTIREKIVSQILAQSSGPVGEANPTVDYVECSIKTELKPQYASEWKEESAGVPPSCLLGQSEKPTDCMIRRN